MHSSGSSSTTSESALALSICTMSRAALYSLGCACERLAITIVELCDVTTTTIVLTSLALPLQTWHSMRSGDATSLLRSFLTLVCTILNDFMIQRDGISFFRSATTLANMVSLWKRRKGGEMGCKWASGRSISSDSLPVKRSRSPCKYNS